MFRRSHTLSKTTRRIFPGHRMITINKRPICHNCKEYYINANEKLADLEKNIDIVGKKLDIFTKPIYGKGFAFIAGIIFSCVASGITSLVRKLQSTNISQ